MRVPRKNTKKPTTTQEPPATRLKRIRERTGITALECARAYLRHLGKDERKASPNSWYRWESTAKVEHTALPDDVIASVLSLLVAVLVYDVRPVTP